MTMPSPNAFVSGREPGKGTNPFDDYDASNDSDSYSDNESHSYYSNDDSASYAYSTNDIEGTASNANNNNNNNDNTSSSTAPVEASWQFLGDLPYRRITLYDRIEWGHSGTSTGTGTDGRNLGIKSSADSQSKSRNQRHKSKQKEGQGNPTQRSGLACLPPQAQTNIKSSHLTPAEYAQFLASTTRTIIASCPNGGPVATVTVPLVLGGAGGVGASSMQSMMTSTQIRIMTNAGQILSMINFPPPDWTGIGIGNVNMNSIKSGSNKKGSRTYTASDILTIGFTSRCILILVLRDSLCFTYNLLGKPLLPSFYILNEAKNSVSLELMEANVYDGGVAVLSSSMSCALVELLDGRNDDGIVGPGGSFDPGCHIAARIVRGYDWDEEAEIGDGGDFQERKQQDLSCSIPGDISSGTSGSSYHARITPLATAAHANANYVTYTSIAVLPRVHTQSRHPEVFLGTSNNSVIICDTSAKGGIVDVNCQERIASPIVQMKFAPNGRFLACFTQKSIMTVISTNFETKVLDFDTSDGSSDLPHNMEWCGEDSVVLHWKNLGVLMVGPYGDWLRFPYNGVQSVHLHLCAEMDCCRVITDQSVEILQRVPPTTAAMLRIGSIEPSAMLLDASNAFQCGSPASDEAARAITKTGLLMDAIEVCIDAASKELDVEMQKRLLRAASYGMHFDYKDGNNGVLEGLIKNNNEGNGRPSEVALMFVEAAKKIRVLNALRDPSIGIVLTVLQYDSIEATGVVARLIAMKRPALATSLSTYLQLDESVRAYARAARAAAYVATADVENDSETTDAAIKILNAGVKSPLMNRGGYATVALAANKAGRQGVANLLLTLETSVVDKVPGLTAIGLYSDAAAVAANAKNDDLIFHVLAEFEKACIAKNRDSAQAQLAYLNTVVKKFPTEAKNLLSKYFAYMHDIKHVVKLRNKSRDFAASGTVIAKRALSLPREQDRLSTLQEASRVFGQGKEAIFLKTSTDEYLELILEQERLRRAYGQDVTGKTSSVTDTIFNVLCYAAVKLREGNKLLAESERLAKKFKVPEKRLWHTKIRAFAATEQWKNLRSLAESRTKIPISFKFFAVAAIKQGRDVSDVLWYIQKVIDSEERYDLYCEVKLWKRALGEARRLQDVRRAMHIKTMCNNPEVQRLCDDFISNHA